MSKLISANFSRLFRNGAFILYMIFCGGLSLFLIIKRYADYHNNMEYLEHIYYTIDGIAFLGMMFIMFAVPVFVANFVCTEYSDGTIRNKLIVGHKRSNIYFANLIVCTAGTLMGVLLNLLINLTLGVALCGVGVLTVTKSLKLILINVTAFISLTAVVVAIAMLINSKAGASVTTVMLTFIIFFVSISLDDILFAPEYYENSFNLKTMETETVKNPDYPTGIKRKVYQTVYNVMPTSHIYETSFLNTENVGKSAGYDGIVLIATTALGIILFRRKELK